MLRFTLPWSVLVSVNERTVPIKGRQYLTKRYRAALQSANLLVMAKVRGERPKYATGQVELHLDFYRPDARRRDCGNYVKALEDSMIGVVFTDDSQVTTTIVRDKGVDRDAPRVVVTALRDGA